MSVGFVYDLNFLKHDAGPSHPERPERLTHTFAHIRRCAWFDRLIPVTARTATDEELAHIHSAPYIERARRVCAEGRAFLDTPDVGISSESYAIAKLAAGSALALADAVMDKRINSGFALLRPPGHHAERDMAMGFCLFNSIAVLARYLQARHGLERIAILDWDVHHGNGTQHLFDEDPGVYYMSLHQYPFYPGTGSAAETGAGKGKGTTLNCPMRQGAGDAEYREAFQSRILPALNGFKPDAILLSAGFDAHRDDPLAQINLTEHSFGWMTREVMQVAHKHSQGRMISLLEGGYDLNALALSVERHLEGLLGINQ